MSFRIIGKICREHAISLKGWAGVHIREAIPLFRKEELLIISRIEGRDGFLTAGLLPDDGQSGSNDLGLVPTTRYCQKKSFILEQQARSYRGNLVGSR